MKNYLLEAWYETYGRGAHFNERERVFGDTLHDTLEIASLIKAGRIERIKDTTDIEKRAHKTIESYHIRSIMCRAYSWAVPTPQALRAIKACGKVIELGAGRGYWARLVQDIGGWVEPFDLRPPDKTRNGYHFSPTMFTDVRVGGVEVFGQYRKHYTPMLCWPPYQTTWRYQGGVHAAAHDDMAYRVLRYEPNRLIYIGEDWGGCNASDAFFKRLEERYVAVEEITIPQWDGLHDSMWIYERRK